MENRQLESAIRPIVDAGALAGAAMLVWKNGQANVTCVGNRNLEDALPVARDTIYRIASLSKPITSVLALMLHEQGRFDLGDPISRIAPEFSNMRVLHTPDGPLNETSAAARSITFDDLLTHRSGLTYGDFHQGPISTAYANALGGDIDTDVTTADWIDRLSALPLIDQPGRAFHYGKSTDLLGLLIERIEGAPLADVLKHRIFDPLGMTDTGFIVDKRKHARRAGNHGFDANGRLATLATVPGGHAIADRLDSAGFVSAGQGLWSTLDDYLAFARLFVEQGASGGVRLLQPDTMAKMAANRLTPSQRATSSLFGQPIFAQGHGFGLGVAVVTEPDKADPMRCGGGKGAVGWPGAYGAWWQADPNDGSILIFLTHNMVQLEQLMQGIGLAGWQAVQSFQAIGTAAE